MPIDYRKRTPAPAAAPASPSPDAAAPSGPHPASLPPAKPSPVPYRDPGPTPPLTPMDWDQEFHGAAQRSLDRLKHVVGGTLGLSFLELDPAMFGVGIAVGFGDTDFIELVVAGGGNENSVTLSCGVLRSVRQDRLLVLHECNRLTQDRPAYPFFLHDAEIGWDVHVATGFPLPLLLNTPDFLGMMIRGLPQVAAAGREQLLAEGVGGVPYRWERNDLQQLLLRSLM